MYNSILIPVDMAQIEKAESMIDIARAQCVENCQITLLNVVEEIPVWVSSTIPSNILSDNKQSAYEKLAAIAGQADIPANIQVRTGHPYRTILAVAEEIQAELIIVASHNPDLGDYFLGSTAAKVVRHASCSVFVARSLNRA
jgi:universal stress protein F